MTNEPKKIRKKILEILYEYRQDDMVLLKDFLENLQEADLHLEDKILHGELVFLEEKGYLRILGKFMGQPYLYFHALRITANGISFVEENKEQSDIQQSLDASLKRAIHLKEKLHSLIDLVGDELILSDDLYAQERAFFLEHFINQVPNFLKNCRTRSDVTSLLKKVASGGGSWQARRDFIDSEFSGFLNFLEFGELPIQKAEVSKASIENGVISIALQDDVFSHVRGLLETGHFYNAVEEAYKIVRTKLKNITGKERATDAFCAANYEKIFGHQPMDDAEKDFFEGVKFLHMAIQFLRNEKAHKPADKMDRNLAIHYISLASLSYDLINRNND